MVNLTIADGRATKAYALWNFEENSSYECHLSLPLQQPPLPFKGLLLHVRLSGAGPSWPGLKELTNQKVRSDH